jgi:hypothetical protein
MGYLRDARGRLCCGECGVAGGVRKRPCPYKVTSSRVRGTQLTLPYCSPPAYCADCYRRRGGLRGVHGEECRDGAAAMQERDDAERARLESGDSVVISACSGPHSLYPSLRPGETRVTFQAFDGTRTVRVVPSDRYHGGGWLSDFTDASAEPPTASTTHSLID